MKATAPAGRVRWTTDEREAVVRRCKALREEFPTLKAGEILERCQDVLPPERRRPLHPALRSALSADLRTVASPDDDTPVPSEAAVADVSVAVPQCDPTPPPEPKAPAPSASACNGATHPSPSIAAMVETGVQVLLGVLTDARVKTAVANLLSQAPTPFPTVEIGEPKQRWVVVAGIPSTAVGPIQKALQGAVDLRFWSPDQPRELLQELLPEARLVIGMSDGLSSALDSSLQSLGPRYVRHASGVSGLYRRLAEEVMG